MLSRLCCVPHVVARFGAGLLIIVTYARWLSFPSLGKNLSQGILKNVTVIVDQPFLILRLGILDYSNKTKVSAAGIVSLIAHTLFLQDIDKPVHLFQIDHGVIVNSDGAFDLIHLLS